MPRGIRKGKIAMSHTFVLVHGAWHGGWCWQRVADRLRGGGHAVFTPTLTGLGERSHLLRGGIDLKTHITDIVNVMKWEGLSDVVLCGHSYGGFVISGVAEQMAPVMVPPQTSLTIPAMPNFRRVSVAYDWEPKVARCPHRARLPAITFAFEDGFR